MSSQCFWIKAATGTNTVKLTSPMRQRYVQGESGERGKPAEIMISVNIHYITILSTETKVQNPLLVSMHDA